MKPFYWFAAVILTAFLLWWFCVPEPVRTIPETTEIFRARIRAANKKYGNFPKTIEGNVITIHASYGKVRVGL